MLGDVGHRPAPNGNAEVLQALQRFARGRETGIWEVSVADDDGLDVSWNSRLPTLLAVTSFIMHYPDEEATPREDETEADG